MAGRTREVKLDRALAAVKGGRMGSERVKPDDCTSMAEVRHGIDRLDEVIVALIGERFRYMEAAARIKTARSAVRDEARKAEVIANARRLAAAERVPTDVIEALYETLIEGSIAYELEYFDHLRVGQDQVSGGA